MLSWEKRPFETANLLNPALCSVLLYGAVRDFEQERLQGMPFALSFLILPFVLHKPTRETLPQTARTPLQDWLMEQSQEFSLAFASRTCQLIPYTKESLTFGMQRQILAINQSGGVICGKGKIDFRKILGTPTALLIDNSRLLGRWFAKVEHETLVFKMLGIRP